MTTEPFSLFRAFQASAERHGDRPAILQDDAPVSFAELGTRARQAAEGLVRMGIAPGDRIGLLCPNGVDFPVAYFGILGAGGTVVPLNLLQTPREWAAILEDAGARTVILHPAFAKAAPALAGSESAPRQLIELPGAPQPAIDGATSWTELHRGASVPLPPPDGDPHRIAAILYTSGTTGQAKGAMLSHANLLANTSSVAQALKLNPEQDRILLVLPMFHAFAATVGMLFPLLYGVPIIPLPSFDPGSLVAAVETHGATVFPGVPSMFGVLLRLPEEAHARLASLRFCISGGAAMPQSVMEAFEARFGIPIHEGDGPTECSPVTAVNPIGGPRKPRTIGPPVPGVDMAILDGEGQAVPDGEIGEICVRAPSVMVGYWNRPEETAESFFGDWFRTGDLGTRDEDGYFAIVDRKKDMIIVNGMNVYPRMVEEVLYQLPGVREAAVVGEPDPRHGEIPVAYLALEAGHEIGLPEVRTFCREHLGRYQVPRKLHVLPELPKTAAGKILKRELRKDGEWERGVDSR